MTITEAAPAVPKTRQPHVLFIGDLLPWTGFGVVTLALGRELLKRGDLDLRFISQNDIGDDMDALEDFRDVTVDARSLRSLYNVLSNELNAEVNPIMGGLFDGTAPVRLVSGEMWDGWKPDAAILLGDFAATRNFVNEAPSAFSSVPTFHYCPVEGSDLPPRWNELWSIVRPVAMSQFGAREIGKVVGHEVPMIYHGVNTDAFYPATANRPITLDAEEKIVLRSRDECKKMWAGWFSQGKLPLPKVWALRTDRHMPRKRYNSLIRAMLPVLVNRPEVGLIIHCMAQDQGGVLPDTLSKIPGLRMLIDRENGPAGYAIFGREHPQIILTRTTSLVQPALASLYNAADLYVTTSAEGFGLTIAEALACGTPALGPDYSAVPEVIGPAGQVVPAGLIDNEYDHFWCAVDEAAFARQAEFLLTHQERRQALGRKGPSHVALSFRWSDAAGAFGDLIREALDG